jgi:hypothetical protein
MKEENFRHDGLVSAFEQLLIELRLLVNSFFSKTSDMDLAFVAVLQQQTQEANDCSLLNYNNRLALSKV